jgi:hypothetical protein
VRSLGQEVLVKGLRSESGMRLNRGYDFEERVFSWLNDALESDELPFRRQCISLRRAPRYHSRERDSEIEFDISIEVRWHPSEQPFLIWVWECKDYSSPVQVGDVEEFHAKLQQIGSDRTKGSMAITSSIQDGALRYASSHGIGIVRLLPEEEVIYILGSGPTPLNLWGLVWPAYGIFVSVRNVLRSNANRRKVQRHMRWHLRALKQWGM